MGVRVRYEEGDFKGGLCRIEGERMIIVQRKVSVEKKIESLARCVGLLDLGNVFIVPELRQLIEGLSKNYDGFYLDAE